VRRGSGYGNGMRAIWSGAISFGLVSVPVKMITATESKELKLHFLHSDFVDLDEIDPIYFRKAYYLLPQDGAEKPYRKELLELLRAKAETGVIPERRDDGDEGEVVDLMQALRESVERTKTQRTAARRRKPAPKKKTTKAA
jgi:non-homologous end joining protein Ku